MPMLRQLVEAERLEGIDLSNRITIEVHTCSFRTVRGYTILAALCDEMAFWLGEDSSNPDAEVVDAIKPAMATVPNAILLCASSPYARKGVLWEAYHRYFGHDGPILVWNAPTRTMNPTVPQAFIDAEKGLRSCRWSSMRSTIRMTPQFRTDHSPTPGCDPIGKGPDQNENQNENNDKNITDIRLLRHRAPRGR